MLFSDESIALLVNELFEPVYEMVREVPKLTIDFGYGEIVRRTLRGNIATYVCDSQGAVLDILPGIYDRATYIQQLMQLDMLNRYVGQGPNRVERLREYHAAQARLLAEGSAPARFAQEVSSRANFTKSFVEMRALRIVLQQPPKREGWSLFRKQEKPVPPRRFDSRDVPPADLADWKLLAEDTLVNETVRRRQIHAMLSKASPIPIHGITKWIYKEVLHADLDDPYLGLHEQLFGHYPFAEEDA